MKKKFGKKEEPKKPLSKLEADVAKTNPSFVEWLRKKKPRKRDVDKS